MTPNTLLFALVVSGLVTLSCQQETSGSVDQPTAEPPRSQSSTPDAIAEEVTDEDAEVVEYEPAYPADVSSEGLTQDDVAQQETLHSHEGGEAHSHDDGDHSHGEDAHAHEEEGHAHGDGKKHSHEEEGEHDDHDH